MFEFQLSGTLMDLENPIRPSFELALTSYRTYPRTNFPTKRIFHPRPSSMKSLSVIEQYRGPLIFGAITVAIIVAFVLLSWHAGLTPGNLLDSSIDITEEERIR